MHVFCKVVSISFVWKGLEYVCFLNVYKHVIFAYFFEWFISHTSFPMSSFGKCFFCWRLFSTVHFFFNSYHHTLVDLSGSYTFLWLNNLLFEITLQFFPSRSNCFISNEICMKYSSKSWINVQQNTFITKGLWRISISFFNRKNK